MRLRKAFLQNKLENVFKDELHQKPTVPDH